MLLSCSSLPKDGRRRGSTPSDGCRYVAHQRKGSRTYDYARYAFSNRSPDIRQIFCAHAELLGIAWTQCNDHQIQVARRRAVATLDEFVGSKR